MSEMSKSWEFSTKHFQSFRDTFVKKPCGGLFDIWRFLYLANPDCLTRSQHALLESLPSLGAVLLPMLRMSGLDTSHFMARRSDQLRHPSCHL